MIDALYSSVQAAIYCHTSVVNDAAVFVLVRVLYHSVIDAPYSSVQAAIYCHTSVVNDAAVFVTVRVLYHSVIDAPYSSVQAAVLSLLADVLTFVPVFPYTAPYSHLTYSVCKLRSRSRVCSD